MQIDSKRKTNNSKQKYKYSNEGIRLELLKKETQTKINHNFVHSQKHKKQPSPDIITPPNCYQTPARYNTNPSPGVNLQLFITHSYTTRKRFMDQLHPPSSEQNNNHRKRQVNHSRNYSFIVLEPKDSESQRLEENSQYENRRSHLIMFSGGKKIKVNPGIWIKKLRSKNSTIKEREVNVKGISLLELKQASNYQQAGQHKAVSQRSNFNLKWKSYKSNRSFDILTEEESLCRPWTANKSQFY